MKKPSLQHRAEFIAARSIEWALSHVGRRTAERIGEMLGEFILSPLGIRKEVTEQNLRRAFPEATEGWIQDALRGTYRHLGREVVAMIRLSTLDREAVRERVEIPPEDWAAFEEALAEGKGVILATGHYGNWELAAAAVAARGVPIEAIVKRLSNPLINRRIEGARAALGVETVEMRDAPRQVPRALLSGKSVGIVADQHAGASGVMVPFFGTPASSHRGPAIFALRLGSPLFAAACRALPDGRYRLSGTRVNVERTDSLDDDIERVTAELARRLEEEIREDPAQYFWLHKRWKNAPPPEEPHSRGTGTTLHGSPAD